MIALKDKVNVNPVSGTWPYGELRDNPGDNSGTPVNEELVSDVMQLMEAVMADAGITANGLLDNLANGFQLYQAFIEFVRNKQATETLKGTAEIATNAEVITGTDTERMVVPSALTAWFNNKFGAWTLRSNVADIVVVGGSGVSITASSIKYKVIGKTMHVTFRFTSTNTTVPTYYEILIPDSKSANIGFDFSMAGIYSTVADGANFCNTGIANVAPTKITVIPVTGSTNASAVTCQGSLTFEIA